MYFIRAATSPSPRRRLGITTCLYLAKSAVAMGSFCASILSGALMNAWSHARSRAGDARQVGPDAVALAEAVAGGALGFVEIRPCVESLDWPCPLVGRGCHHLLVVPSDQEIADRGGQKARVVDGGVQHPLAGRLVADHQARKVTVGVQRIGARIQPELLLNQSDVL